MPQSMKWWMIGGVAALVLLGAGVVWAVTSSGPEPAAVTEEDRIRTVVAEFALAVDRPSPAPPPS